MFTVEIQVGGLMEARIQNIKSVAEAHLYAQAIAAAVEQAGQRRLVLCADHRPVAVYSQPVADVLAGLFGNMNRRLDRIAVLVAPTNATLSMQLGRIVREAKNPSRRMFLDAAEASEFLGEVLDPLERRRLGVFLR